MICKTKCQLFNLYDSAFPEYEKVFLFLICALAIHIPFWITTRENFLQEKLPQKTYPQSFRNWKVLNFIFFIPWIIFLWKYRFFFVRYKRCVDREKQAPRKKEWTYKKYSKRARQDVVKEVDWVLQWDVGWNFRATSLCERCEDFHSFHVDTYNENKSRNLRESPNVESRIYLEPYESLS